MKGFPFWGAFFVFTPLSVFKVIVKPFGEY
jgi:hypothetical protein